MKSKREHCSIVRSFCFESELVEDIAMRIAVLMNSCKRSRKVDGNCWDEEALLAEATALVAGLHSMTVAAFGHHRVIPSADCVLDKSARVQFPN